MMSTITLPEDKEKDRPAYEFQQTGSPGGEIGVEFATSASLLETGVFSDVEIIVGPPRIRYKLHKNILCRNSGYFLRALGSNRFKEGQTSIIELPEEDPHDFWMLAYWLYNGKVRKPVNNAQDWLLTRWTGMLRTSLYYDVPSLRQQAINGFLGIIDSPHRREPYNPGQRDEGFLVAAAKTLLEILNSSDGKIVKGIFQGLIRNKLLPQLLADEEIRMLLLSDAELAVKVLEISMGS